MVESEQKARHDYAKGMCNFVNEPTKDCQNAANKWLKDLRNHFAEQHGNNQS